MAKAAAKNKDRPSDKPKGALTADSRSAVYLTVGWMLAVFTALMLEICFLSLSAFARDSEMLLAMAFYFYVAALIIGTSSLVLGFVAARVRKVQPPRGLQTFAYIVGALPWALWVLSVIGNRF